MTERVKVVGAGLAGCEAAWQLAKRGIPVTLYEMKPACFSPAHHKNGFAELVCSNSLKADYLSNASGLLKAEMRMLDSLIMRAADASRLPAGGALAVDRDAFSDYITNALENEKLIEIRRERVDEVPSSPAVIATGPLTHEALAASISALPGCRQLHFFDAEAPIVTLESLNQQRIFAASRYGKGDDDYLNCPMTQEEYDAFYDALISAETAEVHEFDAKQIFEGCIAVEILASRGRQTLAFGPMKPVGLIDPRTGKRPYAVVQLRRDNMSGTLYNLVGFQTRLKFGEQKRVFSMIPGLENAEFARYGVMHRNTYLNSPDALGKNFALKGDPLLRFAGQMTGVEGYVESAASGLVAGASLALRLLGKDEPDFGGDTLLGALSTYVMTPTGDFQPMNANFGLLKPFEKKIRNKKERYELLSQRSLTALKDVIQLNGL